MLILLGAIRIMPPFPIPAFSLPLFQPTKQQMEKDRIIKALNKLEPAEAASIAWHYLQQAKAEPCARIVDPATGRYALSFTANGTQYKVRTAEDGIGLRRYQALKVEMTKLGFDASMTNLVGMLKKIESLFNKQQYMAAAAGVYDMMHTLQEALTAFPFAADACCLFIVTEGENIEELPTEAERAKKKADWNAEHIHEQDFFFLCLLFATDWNSALEGFCMVVWGKSPAKKSTDSDG